MKIKVEDVINIKNIGFFRRDGENWNGFQKYCQIEGDGYFIAMENSFPSLISFFGSFEDKNIISCSPNLLKKFESQAS